MNTIAPKITAHESGGAIIVRIEAPAPAMPPDELRSLSAIADEWGLERRGLAVAVQRAGIPTARIGRQVVARKSDVLGIVERLAGAGAPKTEKASTPEVSYAGAVRRARAK